MSFNPTHILYLKTPNGGRGYVPVAYQDSSYVDANGKRLVEVALDGLEILMVQGEYTWEINTIQ